MSLRRKTLIRTPTTLGVGILEKMKKWTQSLDFLLLECLERRILVMVLGKTDRTKSKGFVGCVALCSKHYDTNLDPKRAEVTMMILEMAGSETLLLRTTFPSLSDSGHCLDHKCLQALSPSTGGRGWAE